MLIQHSMLTQQSLVAAKATAEVAIRATAAVTLTIFDFICDSSCEIRLKKWPILVSFNLVESKFLCNDSASNG